MREVTGLRRDAADMPLVSVGLPTYNRLTGLKAALECLMSQTYPNLEIIVSDNCSPGLEVEQLMRDVMKSDARIRYFRQNENIGGAANFEFVFNAATGKYFLWVADDDLCEADFIEKLVTCMEQHHDLVLCACDVQGIDGNDNLLEISRLDSIRLSQDWNRARRQFFRYPTTNIFFCIYGLYRTDILRHCNIHYAVGWRGYTTNGEVPFLAQIAALGRIAAIPEVLKLYRRHADSMYHREVNTISRFDWLMLRLAVRLKLFGTALRNDSPLPVKLGLLNTIIASWIFSVGRGVIRAVLPGVVKRQLRKLLR